jgi:hypothetical protein
MFPPEGIAATHRILESAKQIGRLVVTLYPLTHAGVHEMSNQLLYGASHPHACAIAFINVEATLFMI